MIEEVLAAQLGTVAGLSNKIWPINAKQGASAPYMVYLQTRGEEFGVLKGYSGLNRAEYELNLFHSTYAAMKNLAALVIAKLKTLEGNTYSGILVQSVMFDENSPELWEDQLGLYRKIINISVIY